jgi:hypothetical protein
LDGRLSVGNPEPPTTTSKDRIDEGVVARLTVRFPGQRNKEDLSALREELDERMLVDPEPRSLMINVFDLLYDSRKVILDSSSQRASMAPLETCGHHKNELDSYRRERDGMTFGMRTAWL